MNLERSLSIFLEMDISYHFILDAEYDYQLRDKKHGEYAIGTYLIMKDGNRLVGTTISTPSFFKLHFNTLLKYLRSGCYYTRACFYSHVEILQIQIDPILKTYSDPILKTYWLRLIQRHWKKTFQIQKEKRIQQSSLEALIKREREGSSFIRNMPRLKGMLSMYSSSIFSHPI